MTRGLQCALLLLVLAGAGCAGRGRPAAPAAFPKPYATVRVVNKTGTTATVWAARDSVHSRLGVVDGRSTVELAIPRSYIEGCDSVGFLAFRGVSTCIQKARFAVRGKRRFTLELKPVFLDPGAREKTLCNWQ